MTWFLSQRSDYYIDVMNKVRPDAKADIRGSSDYPGLNGTARFFQTKDGVLVSVEAAGLPQRNLPCSNGVFGMHIHDGRVCSGIGADAFAETKGHYNPGSCQHPEHAGDLPPLFETKGRAYMVTLTGRFTVSEIIGHTIVLHAEPDDFTTQPSGNSGKKIACGIIR